MWVTKTGKIITRNMKHIRHTPVTCEQCLRDQTAKSRTQTLVKFWSTTQYTDISYNPYTAHKHMYTNHGTNTRHSNSNEHNQSHSNKSDRSHKSMDSQQNNIWVNNVHIPYVKDNVWINNANMPYMEHHNRPEVIRTRSG